MRHISLLAVCTAASIVTTAFTSSSSVFATAQDNQIIDLVQWTQDQLTASDLEFDTFSSCNEMTQTLEEYIKDNFWSQRGKWGGIYPMPMMRSFGWEVMEMAFADEAVSTVSTTTTSASNAEKQSISSTSTDFSTTNLQKTGIDEADILKTNGKHIYYYNQREQKIQILNSPLDLSTSTLDIEWVELVAEINLPEMFHDIQMYLDNDQLVILAQRWREVTTQSFLDTGNQVDVIVYDISTPTSPQLERFSELDGSYHDSRRIWDDLYVVNTTHMNRYRPMQYRKSIDDISLTSDDIIPKNIDISYTKTASKKNLAIAGQEFPYHISVNKTDCSDIHFVLPTKESIEQFGLHPSFTTITKINLANGDISPEVTTAFWSTQTIHMSASSLYLTDNFYLPQKRRRSCPPNARCLLPSFGWGNNTLIHKFDLWVDPASRARMTYTNSTLAPWAPLTQYSMDEDSQWHFRILTKTRQPELATHLYILDADLDVIWRVEDIEPGEEFKSSRYIGDKLYLVTFEQIDPLFVIDMETPTAPEIIGELKIPWFSTYLHPYGPYANWVQYLIWLWRDTQENRRWGVQNAGVKVDLYKIDYTKKDQNGYVDVSQAYTKTRWWLNSDSEALTNPRMFVWDKVNNSLILPMHLRDRASWNQRCEIIYDPSGKEVWRDCREDEWNELTTFLGTKVIHVSPEEGISERESFDYRHLFQQDDEIYNSHRNGERYNTWNIAPRVWYMWDALYSINSAFAHVVYRQDTSIASYTQLWSHNVDFTAPAIVETEKEMKEKENENELKTETIDEVSVFRR